MSGRDRDRHGARLEKTRHPGIYRRGEKYVAVWREGGSQRRATFRTLAEAREAKRRSDLGERPAGSRIRFAAYVAEWQETYRGRSSRGISTETRAGYVRAIERFALPVLGDLRLGDIRPGDIRRLVSAIEDAGLKPATVRRYVAAVKVVLATAVEDGLISSNPASVVRISRRDSSGEEPEPARVLTREEIGRLRAATDPEWLIVIDLLLHTALRIGELCGLQWSDLDLGERPALHVRRQLFKGSLRTPKSRAGRRTIPLSPQMASRLRERRQLTPYDGDQMPVFASLRGTPLDPGNLRHRVLNPALRRAGLEGVHFHTLRHTCASLLVAEGRNIKQVQAWLGHHDAAFTLSTYVHLLDEGVGDAAFLDDITPPQDPGGRDA